MLDKNNWNQLCVKNLFKKHYLHMQATSDDSLWTVRKPSGQFWKIHPPIPINSFENKLFAYKSHTYLCLYIYIYVYIYQNLALNNLQDLFSRKTPSNQPPRNSIIFLFNIFVYFSFFYCFGFDFFWCLRDCYTEFFCCCCFLHFIYFFFFFSFQFRRSDFHLYIK